MVHTLYKAHKKNEKISRSNQFGQNATIFYRKQLFRLDPEFSGLCLKSVHQLSLISNLVLIKSY